MEEKKQNLVTELLELANNPDQRQALREWADKHIQYCSQTFVISNVLKNEVPKCFESYEDMVQQTALMVEKNVLSHTPTVMFKIPDENNDYEKYMVEALILK